MCVGTLTQHTFLYRPELLILRGVLHLIPSRLHKLRRTNNISPTNKKVENVATASEAETV